MVEKETKKGSSTKIYGYSSLLLSLHGNTKPPHFLSPKHTLLQTPAVVIMTLQKGQNRHRDA